MLSIFRCGIILKSKMEHNGSNPNIASATLCRAGCGFYGNAAFEGMCSKCYKDSVKRRQQNPTPTQVGSGRVSPAGASVSDVVSHHSLDATLGSLSNASALSLVSSTTPSVDTATTTVPTPSTTSKTEDKEAVASKYMRVRQLRRTLSPMSEKCRLIFKTDWIGFISNFMLYINRFFKPKI